MTLFDAPPADNSLFSEKDRVDDWTILIHPAIPVRQAGIRKSATVFIHAGECATKLVV